MNTNQSRTMSLHPTSFIVILRYIFLQIPGTLIFISLIWWLSRHFSWPREWVWTGIGLWLMKEFGMYPVVWKSYAPASHIHGMMGEVCEVKTPLDPRGRVFVQGEVWKAEVSDGKTSISVGEKVRVTGVDGLTLFVEPI